MPKKKTSAPPTSSLSLAKRIAHIDELAIIFPNQLFVKNPCLIKRMTVLVMILPQFETAYNYHKCRIVMMRSTLHWHVMYLRRKRYTVLVYDSASDTTPVADIVSILTNKTVHMCDPIDWSIHEILKPIKNLKIYSSPMFILDEDDICPITSSAESTTLERVFSVSREHLNKVGITIPEDILRTKEPTDDMMSDVVPDFATTYEAETDGLYSTAITYTRKNYPRNAGMSDRIRYPISSSEAHTWIQTFCRERLPFYCKYYYSVSRSKPVGVHPVLSVILNNGLITPVQVITVLMASTASARGKDKTRADIKMSSALLIRGLIVREYMRALYCNPYVNHIDHPVRTRCRSNVFEHTRELSINWLDKTTGINVVDYLLRDVHLFGWTTHTGRQIIASAMLMSKVSPQLIYTWFLEHFVDAYPWCTIPNVIITQGCYGAIISVPYPLMMPTLIPMSRLLKIISYGKLSDAWIKNWDAINVEFVMTNVIALEQYRDIITIINALKRRNAESITSLRKTAKGIIANI